MRILSLIVVLAGMGLFFTSGASTGKACPTSPSAPEGDSLSATEVAFHLRYNSPSLDAMARSRDRWLARDKALHVTFSGLWTLSTQYVLVQKADWSEGEALPASIASAAAVGLAKEWYDASHPNETASSKDLAADAVGIGLAVGLILL